jgi:dihydropteroate synthase
VGTAGGRFDPHRYDPGVVEPAIMGVLNVTPDSFSDGGRYDTVDAAVAGARAMVAEGAAVVDVGGESTRPGAAPVDVEEELRRVVPVVEALAGTCRISVDTRHAEVARAAVAAGASIINDVGASLAAVAAELGVTWLAMHMQGEPPSMQDAPHYDDVVSEVRAFLVERAEEALSLGVPEVWIDPGIGFGKTRAHNLALLGALDELVGTGFPVAVGVSRKGTMGWLTAASDDRVGLAAAAGPLDRLEASLAVATWAMSQGVAVVRAHDVRAHVHAAAVVAGEIRRAPALAASGTG